MGYSREYSFDSFQDDEDDDNWETVTGITACEPRRCKKHIFRESEVLGSTSLSAQQVNALLEKMRKEWLAKDYDFTRKNCCSFSDALARALGVGGLPGWVARLARTAAPIDDLKDEGRRMRGSNASYHMGDVPRGMLSLGLQAAQGLTQKAW